MNIVVVDKQITVPVGRTAIAYGTWTGDVNDRLSTSIGTILEEPVYGKWRWQMSFSTVGQKEIEVSISNKSETKTEKLYVNVV